MPLDSDIQAILDLFESMGVPDFWTMTPEEARNFELAPPPEVPTPVGGEVADRTIPGSEADIGVRIYRPGEERTGVVLYFHGGGWVIGGLDSHDETSRHICSGSGQTVVSVDYRLAPETRYPGAVTDCFDATAWVAANADELGVDAGRLAVAGDSAGGNLAAAVAQKARDRGGPAIAFQLLIYPVTNADFDTASCLENAEGYFLTRKSMQWFWDHYAPDPESRSEPYAAPLLGNLDGLPPALVQTAEFDPLRDEGEAYAEALRAAGCEVELTRYDGLIHGYFGMQAAVAASRTAMRQACDALAKYLG